MRIITIAATIIVATASLAAVPAAAAPSLATYKLGPIHQICLPPDLLEKVCVQWAPPTQPGQFAGACLKYEVECVAPAHIQ